MQLVWLRNDLRIDDNPALYHACQQDEPVSVIYISTPLQWQKHHESSARLAFCQQALLSLAASLGSSGIALSVVEVKSFEDTPAALARFCESNFVTGIWFNIEYAVNERQRDALVETELNRIGVKCHSYQADLLIDPPILNQQGKPYKVFTPWYRAWISRVLQLNPNPLPAPTSIGTALPEPQLVSITQGSFREDLFPASENAALDRLHAFMEKWLVSYNNRRDFPGVNATSTLSPYLSNGLISARRCLYEVQQHLRLTGDDWLLDPWVRQLGWREFYRNLMLQFPRISMNWAFQTHTDQLRWEYDEKLIAAWQQGLTGFPIIDAGMRQLRQTGWMHNRLRMLTASFFSKLMLCDWRLGERFFMQSLIDGDFANNNGGWQWCASTGCDASPWFRIFNPISQSRKFDSEGVYLRKFLPELSQLDNKDIHDPPSAMRKVCNYPESALDYKTCRLRVIERFKQLDSSANQ
jgi:deoxyribodipyrimidine photo-lyase